MHRLLPASATAVLLFACSSDNEASGCVFEDLGPYQELRVTEDEFDRPDYVIYQSSLVEAGGSDIAVPVPPDSDGTAILDANSGLVVVSDQQIDITGALDTCEITSGTETGKLHVVVAEAPSDITANESTFLIGSSDGLPVNAVIPDNYDISSGGTAVVGIEIGEL
ncbi:MAG: hypothetical protein AAGF73_18795 [Actinomycetota bacterium]